MTAATLCITTYLRPDGLRAALDAVAALRVPPGWALDVVVVDNDAAGTGQAVVDAARARGLDVRYVVEPVRGISQVRNRAVAEAAGSTWLLFLDDDEAPAADWLERLVAVQQATDADVTIGPSVPTFEIDPPAWIRDGGFFERERFATGDEIPFWHARTSGVLVRTSVFAPLGPRPFDEALALSGGEDRSFFARIHEAGGRFAWADDALVVETVPASRARLGWILRRAYRTGNSRSTSLLRVERAGLARRVKRVGRGVLDVGRGVGRALVATETPSRVRGLQLAANGAGLVAGALGVRYEEYRRVHGH
jgi:glycosyltransferase involved in cell wall biosynthesis